MAVKYYSNLRTDLIRLVEVNKIENALEIGGGNFDTLKHIVETHNCNGVGVDIRVPESVNKIKFYQFDLDKIDHDNFLKGMQFDLILAGDVLEHTIYPEKICSILNGLLSPNGNFILSVPNIRSIRALYWIFFKGIFPRNNSGLFDSTHRSWFTYKNMANILNENNFEIVKYRPLGRFEKYFFGKRTIFSEFFALQHCFVVKRK